MFIKRQSGLSLIELMIGLLVGAIVVAGALKTFTGSAKNSKATLNVSTLNQDLRAMMDIMVRDIRRAGYVASPVINDAAAFLTTIRHNPFANINIESNGSCIAYLYNKDSVNPNSVEDSERLGFKKVKDTTFSPPKTVLRMRRSSPDVACNSGTWESITSPAVEVTDVTFTLEEIALNVSRKQSNPTGAVETPCAVGDKCLFVRKVTISLSGALNEDATLMQTITESVRVRNDYYCTIGRLNPRVCI